MSKVIQWLKIYREFIRVGPFFVLNLMLVLSALLSGLDISIYFLSLVLSMISISLAWNFGVIVNDYYDMEIDRINYPDRPVVRGALTTSQLRILAISHIIISLTVAIFVNIYTMLYSLSVIVILFLYSVPKVRIKKTILATGVIGFTCGMAILIGASASLYTAENLYMTLWVTIGISLLGPIKDFKDIEGDRAEGMKTLPILFGVKKATYILIGFATFSVILGVVILEFLLLKPILASILVIILGIVTIILLVLNLKQKIDPRKAHNITFILLSICLLSFFL